MRNRTINQGVGFDLEESGTSWLSFVCARHCKKDPAFLSGPKADGLHSQAVEVPLATFLSRLDHHAARQREMPAQEGWAHDAKRVHPSRSE